MPDLLLLRVRRKESNVESCASTNGLSDADLEAWLGRSSLELLRPKSEHEMADIDESLVSSSASDKSKKSSTGHKRRSSAGPPVQARRGCRLSSFFSPVRSKHDTTSAVEEAQAVEVDAVRLSLECQEAPASTAEPKAHADGAGRSSGECESKPHEQMALQLRGLPLDANWSFEAALVEVKGPNDRLMERQRAWLAILCASGADARVCKVSEKGLAKPGSLVRMVSCV